MVRYSFFWLLCTSMLLPVPTMAKTVLLAQADAANPPKAVVAHKHKEAHTPAVAGSLTLDAAIERALSQSPRLQSAGSALMASKGERRQAGAFPNPELGVEAENIHGDRDYRGFNSAEVTYGISQTLDLAKRGSRIQAAEQGLTLSHYDYEAARLNLIRNVTVAYAEAVAAQEHLKLATEQKELADDVYREVSGRVGAAREPLIQKSKAEVVRSTAKIDYERALRQVMQAKRKLAALWGGTDDDFPLDGSAFFAITKPEALPDLQKGFTVNPDVARWDTEVKRSEALFAMEKDSVIPDPTVSVGVRDFRESGDKALVAGISIPIPVLDANRGNISKTRHELNKAMSDRTATHTDLSTELASRYQELEIAYEQASTLHSSILPAAKKAFALSRDGYRAGKFAYLEVLDAQRTMFEAREQDVATHKDYHTARAEVERLTAWHLKKKKEASHEE